MRGVRASTIAALVGLGVVGAVLAERAGRQRVVGVDLAAGLIIGGSGLVAVARRPARLPGALLVAAAVSWFVAIPGAWSHDIPGNPSRLLAFDHRALVTNAVLAASGRDDPGPPAGRWARSLLRAVVVALGYVVVFDRDLARSAQWTAGLGLAVVTVLVLDAAARRRPTGWTAAHTAGAVAGTLAWVGAASWWRGTLSLTHRTLLYAGGMATVALAVAAWALAHWRPDPVVVLDSGSQAELRFGFQRALDGSVEQLDGTAFVVGPRERMIAVDVGDELGEVLVAYRATGVDADDLRSDLRPGLRLLADHHRALAATRTSAAAVAASLRRIERAEELASIEIAGELERAVVRRIERAGSLLVDAPDDIVVTSLEELRGVCAAIRALAAGLAPDVLDEGLAEALERLATGADVPVTIDVERGVAIDPTRARIVYFAAAECITNAVRHAGASAITVSVARAGDEVMLTVADDGSGGTTLVAGGGLAGLAARAATVGGSLAIAGTGAPMRGGTVITVRLPPGAATASA